MVIKKEVDQKRQNRKYLIGEVPKISAPNFIMNPAELYQYLPKDKSFIIKRVYWITNPVGKKKSGQHSHIKEEELFIVIQGNSNILLDDNGKGIKKIKLGTNKIVWIPNFVWHGFDNMSNDCIILALSSTNYNPNRADYIENYEEFKKIVKK